MHTTAFISTYVCNYYNKWKDTYQENMYKLKFHVDANVFVIINVNVVKSLTA